jgi:protein-S-isoprenylcysteine O-methyltransferase Ste14
MYTDLPYRLVLIAIAGLQLAISRRYLHGAEAEKSFAQPRAEGPLLAWSAGLFIAAYGIFAFLWLLNPGWMAWAAVSLPAGLRWCGAPCMVLGAALHLWGSHHLGRNLTVTISTREDHALITSGPYHWVRHPLYTGGMIESLGVMLLVANWAAAMSATAFWIVVALRTSKEEAVLVATFGADYREYQRRAGRFLPRWRDRNNAA